MCLIVFCNAVFSQSTSKICTLIRFTLFSNGYIPADVIIKVLLPYRFTLFSNKGYFSYKNKYGFTTLQIYTILKQDCKSTNNLYGFTTLQIYTILKLGVRVGNTAVSFTTLQIYTILKLCVRMSANLSLFYYLIDLHYSQTLFFDYSITYSFYYLIDLHYSQTTLLITIIV